jgi:formaldehyde-activating enzyme involved in methanogenesis
MKFLATIVEKDCHSSRKHPIVAVLQPTIEVAPSTLVLAAVVVVTI